MFIGSSTFSPSVGEQKGQQVQGQVLAAPLLLQHWSRGLGRQDHYGQTGLNTTCGLVLPQAMQSWEQLSVVQQQ